MQNRLAQRMRRLSPLVRLALTTFTFVAILTVLSSFAMAQAPNATQPAGSVTPSAPAVNSATVPSHEAAGEANLQLPDLSSQTFLGGIDGHKLLMFGLIICVLGLVFGLVIYVQLKNMPVHRTMREVSELIYETCKTYLITQGKFIAILWIFIAVVIGLYFGKLAPTPGHPVAQTVLIILAFSIVGILGSYGVAWFGIRINTFANSRTAFAGLRGKPYPIYAVPLMLAPAVFAFGLVAFGFLGMGPVTIAVDSYGPVTDNAQSVYELSLIEQVPVAEIKREFNIDVNFERAKHLLEENDGAGNTFKATAKPVLIGTAVVGATTMIFSIIMALTDGLTANLQYLSLLHAPFVLGLITGGAIIYWFTGASTQAVTTGAYRAVEFIKANIKLEGVEKASVADSKKVVEICTKYAQKGMFNIFLTVFFATLAFAFVEPFFFIGYLISIAIFGLYQAIFMANAGGAWDNAKKVVEVELKQKGTPLHDATVVGDTVGDPFKDTSSVAMNPVIKFTTLFGLLAVELAVKLTQEQGAGVSRGLAVLFFAISVVFVWRSFYGMRIGAEQDRTVARERAA